MPDETMRAELAPCPFCKCEPYDVLQNHSHAWRVVCPHCGCLGPESLSKDEAVSMWQASRASAAPGGEPVAMREALRAIGDYAHDKSTGPAVPDALWEVRSMAYEALDADSFVTEPPMEMWLCESERLVLHRDQPYIFRVDPECASCAKVAAAYTEPLGDLPVGAVHPPSDAGQRALLGRALDALRRTTEMCEAYADWIKRNVMSADIEQHPYLPELEGVAEDARAAISESEGSSACPK